MFRIVRKFSTKVITKKQVFFDTTTLRVIGGTGGRGVSSFQSSSELFKLIGSDSTWKIYSHWRKWREWRKRLFARK